MEAESRWPLRPDKGRSSRSICLRHGKHPQAYKKGEAVERLSPCRPDQGEPTTEVTADRGRPVAGSSATFTMQPSVCCEMSRKPGAGETTSCVWLAPGSGYFELLARCEHDHPTSARSTFCSNSPCVKGFWR